MAKEYEIDRPLITINPENPEYPIEIRVANSTGYIPMKSGNVADLSFPNSKLRRGRVQGDGGDICPTITCGGASGLCVITLEDN